MAKQLSKTTAEYFSNGGWSSHHFVKHAEVILDWVSPRKDISVKLGRTVIHVTNTATNIGIKFYVHYNGRSKEFMTITDKLGNELKTYHSSINPLAVIQDVASFLGMTRYTCHLSHDFGKTWEEHPFLYADSKREINEWASLQECKYPGCNNLDWRVGFVFKFRDSPTHYSWVHSTGKKAGQEVKP